MRFLRIALSCRLGTYCRLQNNLEVFEVRKASQHHLITISGLSPMDHEDTNRKLLTLSLTALSKKGRVCSPQITATYQQDFPAS